MLSFILLFTCMISGLSAATGPDAHPSLIPAETQDETQAYASTKVVAAVTEINEQQAHAFLVPEIEEKGCTTVCHITPTNGARGLTVIMEDIQRCNPCLFAVNRDDRLFAYVKMESSTSSQGVGHIILTVFSEGERSRLFQDIQCLRYTTNAHNVQKARGPFVTYNREKCTVGFNYNLPTSTDNNKFTLTMTVDLDALPVFVIHCTDTETKQSRFTLGYDQFSLQPTPIKPTEVPTEIPNRLLKPLV